MSTYLKEAHDKVKKAFPGLPEASSMKITASLVGVARRSGTSVEQVIHEAQVAENVG